MFQNNRRNGLLLSNVTSNKEIEVENPCDTTKNYIVTSRSGFANLTRISDPQTSGLEQKDLPGMIQIPDKDRLNPYERHAFHQRGSSVYLEF